MKTTEQAKWEEPRSRDILSLDLGSCFLLLHTALLLMSIVLFVSILVSINLLL